MYMKDNNDYLFCYIDELDNMELINFTDELLSDIEYLKEIKEKNQLEFEFRRLGYALNIIKERNIDKKELKLSI